MLILACSHVLLRLLSCYPGPPALGCYAIIHDSTWTKHPYTGPKNYGFHTGLGSSPQHPLSPQTRKDLEAESLGFCFFILPPPPSHPYIEEENIKKKMHVVVSGGSRFGTLYIFLRISGTVDSMIYLRQGTLTLDCG